MTKELRIQHLENRLERLINKGDTQINLIRRCKRELRKLKGE